MGEWVLPVPGLPAAKPHRATDNKSRSQPGCGEDTSREKEHCNSVSKFLYATGCVNVAEALEGKIKLVRINRNNPFQPEERSVGGREEEQQ